jgi:hypothetical protein
MREDSLALWTVIIRPETLVRWHRAGSRRTKLALEIPLAWSEIAADLRADPADER